MANTFSRLSNIARRSNRDGDGLIKTSRGLGDIFNWDGSETGTNNLGGVSAADDECIINYTRVPAAGARTIAVDAHNDIWVGAQNGNCAAYNQIHCKVNGITGQVVPNTAFQAINGGYGGLIDGNGVLWSANSLIRFYINKRFDMTKNPPVVIDPSYTGENVTDNYGIGIDPNTGYIWFTDFGSGGGWVNPATLSVTNFYFAGMSATRGIAVDNSSNVWVANSGGTTVSHMRTDGSLVGDIDVGCGNYTPMGVAVDSNGKIWVACQSGVAIRIDPTKGPRMWNDVLNPAGHLLGAVDLTVTLDTANQLKNDSGVDPTHMQSRPYNYSDMTGFVSLGATEPSGIWDVVHDAGIAGEPWGIVQWDSSEPAGTGINVAVRAADSYSLLSATNNLFVQVTNDVAFTNIIGRYIEIRASFFHKSGTNATPVLYDLTVSTGTNAVVANPANFCNSDRATMFENGAPLVINVLSNDVAPAGTHLIITNVSPASDGYVTIGVGATNLIYTPNTNFYGVDRFSYTATDGQGGIGRAVVTVEVGQVFPPPPTNLFPPVAQNTNIVVFGNSTANTIDVVAICYDTNNPPLSDPNIYIHNVTQAQHGYVQVTSCTLSYTPNFGYFGTDSLTYTCAIPWALRLLLQ